jgi:hypothetical protein
MAIFERTFLAVDGFRSRFVAILSGLATGD